MSDPSQIALAEMTSEVIAAYVAKNSVPPTEMPALIASVHAAFGSLGKAPEPQAAAEPLKPAVSIRKSVTDEFIISLEDGRKFKSMKRYLSLLGMTPTEYRTKWGLPADYPMVAPTYAVKRAELAKAIGLGRKRQEKVVEAAQEPEAQPDPAAKKPSRRGTNKS